ncbi:deacetylase [Kwoniella heveanensis CBS 569]|uniref:Deacetylase n=1 Tax=Kwoniella heveanensis BCC8398 TaxID=1296120 RepID=A0A1B9GVJ2_9TREE|nr:deacetylase [Kwoniella heveanensis BCC8398]OCF44324.1 deacetylase [Kwoniella heveanensis CBS 569]
MFTKTALTALFSVLAASVTVNAAPTARQNGLQVINSCYNSGQVALTYDDGPYNYENDIANQFGDQKATFFLNGNNYVCIYDRVDQVRALHAAGHTLGSHTWSHKDLTTLSEGEIHEELEKVENAFIKILGLKPLYFRPPYGSYNDLVLSVLAQRGYKKVFLWTDDTGDANGESVQYSQGVIDGVANSYPEPKMVLEHSVIDTTASQVVPYAINRLNNAGYQLVAVDTCLGDAGEWPYEWVGEPGTPDGSWYC